jgi:16S rRNA A1518/A1519 N6-dimethyltransferase RsmA/KsgA/DIM1 with predicted DNA glycosylase/AP lyase activity
LRAALKGTVSAHQIEVAGIDPTLRGEKLTIDDFLASAEVVAKDTDAPGSFGEGGAE